MNRKKVIVFIVFILLIGSIVFIFNFSKIKEQSIKVAIKRANYCEVAADCVDAGGKCPFGCYNYVNKNEVEYVAKLIQSYDSTCIYDCVLCPSAICISNKCVEVCE
jgi:hypothetical protein